MAVVSCLQPAREGKEVGGGLERRSERQEGPGGAAARRSHPWICASARSLVETEGVLLHDRPLGANGREMRVSVMMKVWARPWQG